MENGIRLSNCFWYLTLIKVIVKPFRAGKHIIPRGGNIQ
jgi:hypothetical protein